MDKERRREIREEEEYRAKLRGERGRRRTGRGCLVFILFVVGAITFLFNPPGSNDESSANGNQKEEPAPAIELADGRRVTETEAVVMCHDQIRERLKSPSTAKFPGPFSGEYPRPSLWGNSWVYEVPVDSENGFGAEIRSQWKCVFDGDKETFSITQLE